MESLAWVVVVLFLIGFFAGPLGILLTKSTIKNTLGNSNNLGLSIVNIVRQGFLLILVVFGVIVGVQFLLITELPLFPRMIGVFSLSTCYIALRREFFPRVYIFGKFVEKIGIKRKNGSSSGRDGFGPEGQH